MMARTDQVTWRLTPAVKTNAQDHVRTRPRKAPSAQNEGPRRRTGRARRREDITTTGVTTRYPSTTESR